MNYTALIERRKSVREFLDTAVPAAKIVEIQDYYEKSCQRLIPDIATELVILDTASRSALEGSCGYRDFLIGAPQYLVLLSAPHDHSGENAGYIMEDLILKLTEMGLDSCWITFTNAEKVKHSLLLSSDLEVAAIAAFGYGVKTPKKLRLNILNMSNIDISAQESYYSDKKHLEQLVFVNKFGCTDGLDELIESYDAILRQSFEAAANSPSYLNRQPYAFVAKDGNIILVSLADELTDEWDAKLNLGIVMLHFAVTASQWVGDIKWNLEPTADLELPDGCTAAAVCRV